MDEFLVEAGWKPGDRLVALNPGAGQPRKQWAPARYAAVGERLGAESSARVLLLWGPAESHLAREIALGMRGPGRAAARPLLAPPTDLDELTALLRRAQLMVSGDTGPCISPLRSARLRAGALRPDQRAAQRTVRSAMPRAAERRRDHGRASRRTASSPRRWRSSRKAARGDPTERHHRGVERGGAPARLSGERGLGRRDHRGGRRVHRQDGGAGPRVHRPASRYAPGRASRPRRTSRWSRPPATGCSRSMPTSGSPPGAARAHRAYPRRRRRGRAGADGYSIPRRNTVLGRLGPTRRPLPRLSAPALPPARRPLRGRSSFTSRSRVEGRVGTLASRCSTTPTGAWRTSSSARTATPPSPRGRGWSGERASASPI